MKYKKFAITNYKAIRKKVEIDLIKSSIVPIIGINECDKTTILKSIFCFYKKTMYLIKKQIQMIFLSVIQKIQKVYNILQINTIIKAVIEITQEELNLILDSFNANQYKESLKQVFNNKQFNNVLILFSTVFN